MPLITRLQDAEPFNQLPEPIFTTLRDAATLKSYPAGTDIFRQSDPPTGYLYVIKEGLVEITVMVPGGGDMVLDYRKEGGFFGGTPIFTGEPYTGGARTVRQTECYLIPGEVLQQAEQACPQIGAYFNRVVHSRIRQLYGDIVTDHSQKALTQMEAYPFKKRLSEIMTSPVEACRPEETARQVARRLAEKQISAVLVLNGTETPLGIITERDIISRVVVPDGVDGDSITAREIMTLHPYTMPPETYMYEAMAYMTGHRIKHLPVVDRGELVGIVTLRDLMRYRSQKAMLLIGNIREEQSLEGLTAIRKEVFTVARSLLSETRSTPEMMEILSYIHHGIIRRTYDICMEEMRAEGRTAPPVRHCFLIMGSGGRREMLLGPDQDNGFIFEDVPDDRMAEIDEFFIPFSERLVAALDRVGYPLCHGKVMASNPLWRGRLQDWNARIKDWVNNPEPQQVRYSSIFFDFAPLAGDPDLAASLRAVIDRHISQFQGFLYHMMSLDLRSRVPISMLGRFVLEKSGEHKGELSLKQGGSVYLVDCIRMFALEKGIHAITTLERLDALTARNVFDPETAEHIRAAFEALTFLRLRKEIADIQAGRPPSHYIDPQSLSRNERDLLKEAFGAVSKLQDATKRHFARTPF